MTHLSAAALGPGDALTWSAAALLGLGAIATALTAIVRVVRGAVRTARKIDRVAVDILGEPGHPDEGRERRPGLAERMGGVEKGLDALNMRVARIEYELHPDSGKSLRDAVDRIDSRTAGIAPGGEEE